MPRAYIQPDKCIRCPKCGAARSCPINAIIRISDEDPKVVESGLCRGCGDCVASCPAHAVIIREG